MRAILPGVDRLIQPIQKRQPAAESYRPEGCPDCGKGGLWVHGRYHRNSAREGRGEAGLNPVAIARLDGSYCLHTASVLPECMAPRRGYRGIIQPTAMVWHWAGTAFRNIAATSVPHADTVWRGWSPLRIAFAEPAWPLRKHGSRCGVSQTVKAFWPAVWAEFRLPQARRFWNEAGVCVA